MVKRMMSAVLVAVLTIALAMPVFSVSDEKVPGLKTTLEEGESWLCAEHYVLDDPMLDEEYCPFCFPSVSFFSMRASSDEEAVLITGTYRAMVGGISFSNLSALSGYTGIYHAPSVIYSGYESPFVAKGCQVDIIYPLNMTVSSGEVIWLNFKVRSSSLPSVITGFEVRMGTAAQGSVLGIGTVYVASDDVFLSSDPVYDGFYDCWVELHASAAGTCDYYCIRVLGNFTSNFDLDIGQLYYYGNQTAGVRPGTGEEEDPEGWGIFRPLILWMQETFGGWFDGLASSITGALTVVQNAISSAVTAIGNQISNAVEAVGNFITNTFDGWFSDASDPSLSQGASEVESTLQQQEAIEGQIFEGLQENKVDPSTFEFPTEVLNAMSWIGSQFMSCYDQLGSFKVIFTFPVLVGLSLMILGRAHMAFNGRMHPTQVKEDSSDA